MTVPWRSPVTSTRSARRCAPTCPVSRRLPSTTGWSCSGVAALTTLSTAPERGHPTTYVVCAQESDNSIPVAAQEAMASRAERVVRLSSAHMAQLSVPDELARALADVAELTGVRA
jgi:hypothetical protein